MARVIKDFDTKTQNLFPEYWAVHCQIYYEFCAVTRLQITYILKSLKELDVAVFMKALQKLNDEMKYQYEEWLGNTIILPIINILPFSTQMIQKHQKAFFQAYMNKLLFQRHRNQNLTGFKPLIVFSLFN